MRTGKDRANFCRTQEWIIRRQVFFMQIEAAIDAATSSAAHPAGNHLLPMGAFVASAPVGSQLLVVHFDPPAVLPSEPVLARPTLEARQGLRQLSHLASPLLAEYTRYYPRLK